ncbi:geranylgeranylglyceryl phosphate synthase [Patiriisocius marinistellae]|uniref:Geranylgeranylglyceryl phosphate synthase n=1 Tax=Patiriisocius marinistellae TaxID=2494560 RepID=A0A5J4FT08_9FLAO|nr:geranylgeranylglyceryl/heptaprenylglyceryl phosphate synthase [Patiriisocius marinistellae]GEQ84610.1 geranylgeranylglyceryl phosphate synthase [Patiriisocius marinistellae]
MRSSFQYKNLIRQIEEGNKLLAILIDPEKFDITTSEKFLKIIPKQTTHLFLGGSTVPEKLMERLIDSLRMHTKLPLIIFPGAASQISEKADALLFLSLVSGNNPEYLIGQQKAGAAQLLKSKLEVIPTGYLLIDGGSESAVANVTNTLPMPQSNIEGIVHTALAAELMGAKSIYLEAGSGANIPVSAQVINAVKQVLTIPLIVGGGIRTAEQKKLSYDAGANMVVMGTVFEA